MLQYCYIFEIKEYDNKCLTYNNITVRLWQSILFEEENNVINSFRLMVFNATFINISAISDLLVEETGVPGENHRPVASY